jgi:2'-5' RNA ligase
MRLFVAIDLDDSARGAIAETQRWMAEMLAANRSLKWVNPSHMHLTLAFLGEISDPAVPAVVSAFGPNFDGRPFAVVFEGLGVFPPRGAPRVLWVGVGEGAPEVVGTQRVVRSRAADAGVVLEARPFHPYLTLARWRSPSPDAARRVRTAGPHTPIARMHVDHVTLYHSRLTPAGPVYTALARATLT